MRLSPLPYIALLAVSLSAQGPDFTPPTPLYAAAMRNDVIEAKRLLDAGANPNEGRIAGLPAMFISIMNHNLPLVRAMLEHGADLTVTDPAGSTALMWAAGSEKTSSEIIDELLKRGADPNLANKKGETALAWALRRGHTPIVSSLASAGASEGQRTKDAVERALGLLQKSGDQFTRVSGCTSCHHQSVPQMASGLARQRGFTVNEKISQQQVAAVIAVYQPLKAMMLQGGDRIPDPAIGVSYALIGLHGEGYAPDETTEAMAHLVSTKQRADGSFPSLPGRPPIESSDVSATALSLRSLQLYGKNPEAAVTRAREWLRLQQPRTVEESAMQLLGLTWAGARVDELTSRGRALLDLQRQDGGWAPLSTLETDAYATGQALYALHQAGQISGADLAYRRGAGYLLRTQLADGSWLVRSRSFPFQPYKDSGFPHGKDQWISASGTGWAALALSLPSSPTKMSENTGGQ